MHYMSAEEILRLHFQIIKDFGGAHGVRDEGRLASVTIAPQQVVFGQEQYGDVLEKAAVYCRNLIADHLFVDGNKRTGITVMVIFLQRNGWRLTATPEELEDFAVRVAVDKLDVDDITTWLRSHAVLR
jgi:death-on-curing protein